MGSTLVTIQTHFHVSRDSRKDTKPKLSTFTTGRLRHPGKSGSYSAIEDGDDGEGGLKGDGGDEDDERSSLFGGERK
jgi:hypothetical protein